ncbi:hypothetical protein C0216_31295 (plasmid) [Streptomyces globosus]|uniref:Uncharacterized protein n=1 Tax=Streptomyces globosus TaxID=68209 RepID=A0A344UAS6_9ACTN|nr:MULTISPECIES: DUF6253 family protein [Streptomyces]AXE27997.1 hypothetical protein C0216_31295 [Streptomyces globosus]
MSLLNATGYEAVFATPEGDTYRIPLVCWREDEDRVYGMVLVKGQLRCAERVRHFLRYGTRAAAGPDDEAGTPGTAPHAAALPTALR